MTNETFIFFAELMGRRIRDRDGRTAGRLWDFLINPQEVYPPVTGIVLAKYYVTRQYAEVSWSDIEVRDRALWLKIPVSQLTFSRQLRPDTLRVRRDVLDQQVVDIHNHKVIRVNDVHFLAVNPFRLVHVDIGTRGLIRRMGWETWVDRIVRLFRKRASYLKAEHLISWKFVKTISLNPMQPIQMNLTAKQCASIPPADMGELLMDLDIHQRVALFRTADALQRARLFERFDLEQQQQLLEHLSTKEAVEILSRMSADEAVDLLGDLPPDQSRSLLAMMESNRAKRLSQLLGYEEDEAGGIMTTEFLEIPQSLSVAEALARIRENTPNLETIYYLYVVNDQKQLIGTTTLRQLISATAETPVSQTVYPKPVFVYTQTSLREVAFLMDKYKVSALPVLNKEKVVQGIITVDDVLHHVIPIAWRRRGRKVS